MPVSMMGLSSDIDTQGLIDKLVAVERQPIVRLQYEKQIKQEEKKTWKKLKGDLLKFNDILQKLYGFRRVFKKRKLNQEEDYFQSTVMDNAEKGDHKIEVNQLAAAHKITTDKIPVDKKLSSSTFTIKVGEDQVEITDFNGGTANKLVKLLKKKTDKILKIQQIKMDNDNVVISFEAEKTGEKNTIEITPKTQQDKKLLDELGLFKDKEELTIKFDFNDKQPAHLNFTDQGYQGSPALLIQEGKRETININKAINQGILELFYRSQEKTVTSDIDIDTENQKEMKDRSIKEVTIKDVTIFGADYIINKAAQKKKEEEKTEKGNLYIELLSKNNNKITINLNQTNNWTKIKQDLKELTDINTITIVNDSGDQLFIDNLHIIQQTDKQNFKNVVQAPKDAKLKVDGVDITRDRNDNLNDIIKGVNLKLKKKTPEPITVSITEDKEKIEQALNDFIKHYNKIITYILTAGKNSKASKPGDSNKDRGLLSNDISLMNLHSKMRSTVLNSYKTSMGNRLAILAQLGISTGKWGSAWENINKGLLNMDQDQFNDTFGTYGERISELFGYDQNKDQIIDTGVAYKLSETLKPFIRKRGIIEGKITLADTMIRSKDRNIVKKEEYLEKYRKTLKHKFTKMDQGLQNLKGSRQALENQINNLPGSSKKKKEE